MRYLINIMGPKAVGKTTVIRELLEYLPYHKALIIDDYRRIVSDATPKGESTAWIEMYRDADADYLIVESSGTSSNLSALLEGLNCSVVNILLTANVSTRRSREIHRQQRGYSNPPMYFQADGYNERPTVVKPDLIINTEKEQPYEIAAHIIDLLPSEFI